MVVEKEKLSRFKSPSLLSRRVNLLENGRRGHWLRVEKNPVHLLPQKMRHKDGSHGADQHSHPAQTMDTRRVAAILAVAGAILHEDVVAASAHQTEALVAFDSRLPHVGAAPEISPLPVHLLPDLSAHRRSNSLQVLQFRCLLAICYSQGAVVEGISAFRVIVAATIPTLDGLAWKMSQKRFVTQTQSELEKPYSPIRNRQHTKTTASRHFSRVFILS